MHALKHPKALTFQLLKWDPLKIDRRGLSSIPAYLMGKYLKKCISFFSCYYANGQNFYLPNFIFRITYDCILFISILSILFIVFE